MTDARTPDLERIDALMVESLIDGLDDVAQRELDTMLADAPVVERDGMKKVVAMIDQAWASDESAGELPASLRQQLSDDATRFFDAQPAARSIDADPHASFGPIVTRFARAGWYAAAASIVIAILGWWQVLAPRDGAERLTAQTMASFSRDHADSVSGDWTSSIPKYAKVEGELVWSDAEQTGYMRFVGLAANDPDREQYQLWIVDPDRDKHPIDGGVFDVPTSGEVIVPIDAKLIAKAPKVFAITKEQSGGVVVSAGPHILVAKIES